MLTKDQILAVVGGNPGLTCNEIADLLGKPRSHVSARLVYAEKCGYIHHKVHGRTINGRDIFAYYPNTGITPFMNKAERKQTVSNPQANGEQSNITALISNLSHTLAKQIAAQVVVDLQSQLQRELAAIIPPSVTVPKLALDALLPAPVVEVQPKVRLPRIGILGVAPPKRKPIDDEFGTIFDIVYWWSEDNDSKLKSMSTQCEVIYVMDYVSHKHTQMMQARGANLRRVHGDITALTNLLTEKYLEGVK